jgi:uncharacterized membrane protein YphA (DoxX/SURF4 family)
MPLLFSPFRSEKIGALLLRVTAFCWLLAKFAGWRMFTTYRIFPTAPVLNIFDNIPLPVHTFLFVLAVLLLFLLILSPLNKVFLASLLVCEVLSCLLDQNRLQPWDYQYMFILFIYLVNKKDDNKAIAAFLLMLASTYIYSGLGKLNTGFLHTIWTKMLLEQFLHIPAKSALQPWVQYCGYITGFFELMAGLGLLFNKTRKISAGLLILLHLFILIFLGPFGLRYNMVVWPWNIAMICYLYLVSFRTADTLIPLGQAFSGWNWAVLICWGILPALNFAGWWDNYLSSGIYSGKLPEMMICIKDTSQCKPLRRYWIKGHSGVCNGEESVNVQYWSMAETKMAPYPEIRSYKKIQAKLEAQYPGAGLSFVYFEEGRVR